MRCRTPTIVLLAVALIPLMSGAQERHALVIGNGKYTHIDPLANPPNDVELVAKALKDVGFNVTLLVNADRRSMDDATKKFATDLDDAGRNAVGVFYFAGHGVTYEGENWLLPVSANITQGADIEYESISANKVLRLMEGARNATDILILDACRNSPFRGFSLSGTRALSGGMSRMDAPTGSFIAYSTAPGAVAYDGDGSYSPFAEAFASEVGTPANSIGDMMIEVRKKVKAKTSKLGPRPQTPWDSSSLTGRFAFNPGQQSGSVLPTPDPSPPPDKQQRPRQSGESADTRMWTSIEKSTDPAEFEIYLEKFPEGQYADLAKLRKDRLSRKSDVQPAANIQQSSTSGSNMAIGGQPQPVAGSNTATNNNDELANLCRQFAAGDPETFAECMDEYQQDMDDGGWMTDANQQAAGGFPSVAMPPQQMGQSAVWYDDQFNQWQVTTDGTNFSATTFLPGSGTVVLRGQTQGFAVSYGIFDATGLQIGYGQGSIDDATHLSVISYWSNGTFLGSGRFHINHPPN